MNIYIKRVLPLALAAILFASSCSESKTNTEEKTEINSMDSISKEVKLSTDKLEEQTKKVEESLEKLDKEFEANQ
jgi:hypothetical protein